MSRSVVFQPAADRDVDRYTAYIGQRNFAAGRRFLQAVRQAAVNLAAMPEMGGRCKIPHLRLNDLREWTIRGFENHVMYYRFTDADLIVIRVLHGSRDVERILVEEE